MAILTIHVLIESTSPTLGMRVHVLFRSETLNMADKLTNKLVTKYPNVHFERISLARRFGSEFVDCNSSSKIK